MSEATLILENMRGGCATVGNTVHTLFRFNGRLPRQATTVSRPAAELRAKAERYRIHALNMLDSTVARSIESLAREIDEQAERMERGGVERASLVTGSAG